MRIAITTGEPAGIGPELAAQALQHGLLDEPAVWPADARFTVLGDAQLIRERAATAGVDWAQLEATGRVCIEHIALRAPCVAGQLDAAQAPYVLTLLDAASTGAQAIGNKKPRFDAIVTAPLQKSSIHEARVQMKAAKKNSPAALQTPADIFLLGDRPFLGHTEYFADQTNTPHVVMMLAGTDRLAVARAQGKNDAAALHPLRVALATTHLPLKDISAAITSELLLTTLEIVDHALRHSFGLSAPIILVAGLNPHAGEGGHCGTEEIEHILPALKAACDRGIDARGPYPADTLFQPQFLDEADCVLALYHDQGLPVLKYATFGQAFNITLGLPFIRTSVDHGTALKLAGTGQADPGSFIEAITAAVSIAARQNPR